MVNLTAQLTKDVPMTPDLGADVVGSPQTVILSGKVEFEVKLNMTALASTESDVLVPCVGSPQFVRVRGDHGSFSRSLTSACHRNSL